jgi:pyruvate dehydrogenase E2 component (dihydrolipoamide acetyltransferase)
MEAGTITKWLKSEGDMVVKGEPLFEVDTDKVTQEVEADFGGVLLKIAIESGEAPVGETVAWIGNGGADVREHAHAPPLSNPVPATPPARLKASPLARRIARELEVDLSSLSGTGPEGRIVAEDVQRGRAAPTPAPETGAETESIPLTSVRQTIARRLTAAWQAPVFHLTVHADMTRASELLERVRELDRDVHVTITDLLVKVCAQALMRHRDLNVAYTEDALVRHPHANIGIAVAAPQGLVVPVVHGADRLSLAELAAMRGDVVRRARDNTLAPRDLAGGTFTLSNLGRFGVEQFTAVLNPPQAAILAVGATVDTPIALAGAVAVRALTTITLSVDHRAVDGAEAAEFLRTVKHLAEEPALAL